MAIKLNSGTLCAIYLHKSKMAARTGYAYYASLESSQNEKLDILVAHIPPLQCDNKRVGQGMLTFLIFLHYLRVGRQL